MFEDMSKDELLELLRRKTGEFLTSESRRKATSESFCRTPGVITRLRLHAAEQVRQKNIDELFELCRTIRNQRT